MKEMDCVQVIVEKEKYARDGVHKGMQGWICLPDHRFGAWLVNFPQYGEKEDIATISIRDEDLMLLDRMDAGENERIKAEYERAAENEEKASPGVPGDLPLTSFDISR